MLVGGCGPSRIEIVLPRCAALADPLGVLLGRLPSLVGDPTRQLLLLGSHAVVDLSLLGGARKPALPGGVVGCVPHLDAPSADTQCPSGQLIEKPAVVRHHNTASPEAAES